MVALLYLIQWMKTAAVKGSFISLPDFWGLFLGYSNSVFQGSLQGISEETYRKLLALGFLTTYAPLLHLSEKSIEVNSMKWCQEALAEHACPVSLYSSSFLPAEKFSNASVQCLELGENNQKCRVSPVWGMKCFPWNLEFLCVGGHWIAAEIIPLLWIIPVCLFL